MAVIIILNYLIIMHICSFLWEKHCIFSTALGNAVSSCFCLIKTLLLPNIIVMIMIIKQSEE